MGLEFGATFDIGLDGDFVVGGFRVVRFFRVSRNGRITDDFYGKIMNTWV